MRFWWGLYDDTPESRWGVQSVVVCCRVAIRHNNLCKTDNQSPSGDSDADSNTKDSDSDDTHQRHRRLPTPTATKTKTPAPTHTPKATATTDSGYHQHRTRWSQLAPPCSIRPCPTIQALPPTGEGGMRETNTPVHLGACRGSIAYSRWYARFCATASAPASGQRSTIGRLLRQLYRGRPSAHFLELMLTTNRVEQVRLFKEEI